ncbi:uncharacterized protein B0H18DRAFT_1116152 [Fomitopsis serialis]|uniref:uncharacterized protein n=1 Tax=Fomitopsis serialis TaxID=139415 RepID=UPI002007A217|nr:uncharacterized protein B0H18DRAFT_1116152 [Neoantrodia serialis]KAH9931907.1 hypothetical protein B0H18DRAFT_1116152 [Neoantrodia serialis]
MDTNQNNTVRTSHWRMELNNVWQSNKALGPLAWEDIPAHGHQGPWTAIVRINGIEFGSGGGNSRDDAREAAAHVAYLQVIKKLQGQ